MAPDDHTDDEPGSFGPPLPPDDRLWRHPSEVRDHGFGPAPVVGTTTRERRPAAGWPMVAVAGLAGAALTAGVIAVAGGFETRTIERPVIEKVALTPVVASPMLRTDAVLADLGRRLAPVVVSVVVSRPDGGASSGSGVVYRSDGLVLTSAELIEGASRAVVRLHDGRELEGRLRGHDPLSDVALLEVGAQDLPVAVLGSAEGLEVGAAAIAMGMGPIGGTHPSTIGGSIAAVRQMGRSSSGRVLHGLIRIDAVSDRSALGGALVDTRGAVIGMLTAAGGADGSGVYATPIDVVRRVAEHLELEGRMIYGWLGIDGSDATGAAGPGALVRAVDPGSPASGAGLQADDVITHIDGEEMGSITAVVATLRHRDPGDEVHLGYRRGEVPAEATVVLGARPETDPDEAPTSGSDDASGP